VQYFNTVLVRENKLKKNPKTPSPSQEAQHPERCPYGAKGTLKLGVAEHF